MPNITQLPVIDVAGDQTYFLVVNDKLAKRYTFKSLSTQLELNKIVPVPAGSSSSGAPGQLAFDANYIYICVAENTWRRMAASTF